MISNLEVVGSNHSEGGKIFVTLQLSEKKALKKCRSLPSSISDCIEDRFESSFDSSMVFEKRGYFYESVGGVFYTLEWPVKSSSSEVEMPPNCDLLVDNETNKTKLNCGKHIFKICLLDGVYELIAWQN